MFESSTDDTRQLPLIGSLKPIYAASLVIAAGIAAVSLVGILHAEAIYPAETTRLSQVPVDWLTLLVVWPLLLASMWGARRGALLGLLCWPAPLFYATYYYLANAIGVPFGVLFLPYTLLAGLSAYTLIALLARIDADAVRLYLEDRVPVGLAGGIILGLALLFAAMNVGFVLHALGTGAGDWPADAHVWIVDFAILTPAWLLGGGLLLAEKSLGYVIGLGLLITIGVLLVGPVFVLLYPALCCGRAVPVGDVAFMAAMSGIAWVPLALWVQRVRRG